jgi:hypothetical protein
MERVLHRPDGLRKRAFVLGIYSSAVHACWIGPDGARKVSALALSSEPEIFWSGDNASYGIPVTDARLGRLEPASRVHNGPSGRALEHRYLRPLGLDRHEVWLADMVPHTLSNPGQQRAILKHYRPLQGHPDLPESTIPPVPSISSEWKKLINLDRIVSELEESGSNTIITIGNLAIKYFLRPVCSTDVPLLTLKDYGSTKRAEIHGRTYNILRLAHMRVTVIRPIPDWQGVHDEWAAGNPGL